MHEQPDCLYNETSIRMDEGRTMDIVYLDFSKDFNAVPHNILIDKHRKCGLGEWTVRWIENRLNSRSQRVIMTVTGSSWRPVSSGGSQSSILVQYCLTSPSMTGKKGQIPPQ